MEVKQVVYVDLNNTGLHEKISKDDILKNVGNQQLVANDFHSIFSILWKSMAPGNCLVTNILQNI